LAFYFVSALAKVVYPRPEPKAPELIEGVDLRDGVALLQVFENGFTL
jgi:hypothetical protein